MDILKHKNLNIKIQKPKNNKPRRGREQRKNIRYEREKGI